MTEYVSNCCDAPSDPDMERCSLTDDFEYEKLVSEVK